MRPVRSTRPRAGRTRLGRLLAGAIGLWSAAASAQTVPGNVNDCTLVKDPIELRNCILRYGGERTQPPPMIESTQPAPVDPANDGPLDTIIEVPTRPAKRPPVMPGRSEKLRPRKGGRQAVPVPAPVLPEAAKLPRPNPRDTLVHIEQIETPRRRGR